MQTVQGKGSFVLGVNPGLVHEQRVVEIQKDLEKVLDKAKSYDLSKDEIRDLFEIEVFYPYTLVYRKNLSTLV